MKLNFKSIGKKDIIYLIIIFALAVATVVLSVLLAVNRSSSDEPTYYEKKCEVFASENANFSHGQIVFIGDSLTDGCAVDTFYGGLSLATYNRGIGGDTTEGVLKRLKLSLFELQPEKIVLMIGINDINGNRTEKEILKNYKAILEEIKKNLPEAEVYCVSILPVNKDLESFTHIDVDKSRAAVLEINPKIKTLVGELGYTFVDAYPSFADGNDYLHKNLSVDGIHLNSEGYEVYSEILKPYLD